MANAAALIGAIASLLGVLFGVGLSIWTVRRSSPRERQDAAAGAAMKILDPKPMDQQIIATAVEDYLRQREAHEHD